jgi:predicted amidohydrolase YtcJ
LPFAELASAGVPLAASSDDPCAPVAPLWCSARGATRTTTSGRVFEAEQAVDFEAWLHAYTAGSAYAGGQERERGSIAPGLRADLVVLDGRLDPHDPPTVAETWIAGEQVYAANDDG